MALVSVSRSSSSMAISQSCFSYDVFLSFRGEDTRDGFTDHLYTALKQAGIRTFWDDDAMDRGKLLKPELKKAIHESAISLIVFSEGYASSKWCLDEVLMIIEEHKTSYSKHEFVPVFYKVEPSDVRNQTGSFKDAFDAYDDEIEAETNLEKKTELLEKVGAWRDSLNNAATFTGLVYKDGYESKFIINIVNVVIKKVDNKALYIGDKLVGIENHVAEIESWLQDPSPDAVFLVIDGMGGIGKTTIAKCIFNLNFRNYDGSCFLADINEASNQTSGLCRLQSQLLSTILKSEKEETIWNVDEGTVKVTNSISNKKLLLILDDVATLKQLDVLLGPKRFYPGSKVIIITRHKQLSTAFTVHHKVYSADCPNFGFLELIQCPDSISSFSLLENVNLSYCNLFDNSFPNDWSSLVSLRYLNIDGNNVTSLPKCIQTLTGIRMLNDENCSKILSIVGLPKSIHELFIGHNKSLEKVQLAQNSQTTVYKFHCPKLCEVEGRYKLQSIRKVEKKVIRNLGLESNAGEATELGLEVLHEFGIFSTYVVEEQIPSCFMFKERGSQISFKVPRHHDSSRISGFNMCVVLSQSSRYKVPYLLIRVCNKTKDLLWCYKKGRQNIPKSVEKFAWLTLWTCGNLLEGGDEIVIRTFFHQGVVEECCLNLLYEDDHEQVDGERQEGRHVNAFDQISWTDQMDEDISDYVCSGTTHKFISEKRLF